MYRADRKTPAWYGAETGHCVPLDITNGQVVDYQVENFAREARAGGFDGIAADNFGLYNDYMAAGVYDEQGEWVDKWSGQRYDVAWAEAAVNWLEAFAERVSAGLGLGVVPNFSLHACDPAQYNASSPIVARVANASAAVLSEAGFTGWASARSSPAELRELLRWMRLLQAQGKGYASVNELATSNLTDPTSRRWVVGCFLLGNEKSSAVFLSGIQDYGVMADFPEASVLVGSPVGPPVGTSSNGDGLGVEGEPFVWMRNFTSAFIVVNSGGAAAGVYLPLRGRGQTLYKDLDNITYVSGQHVSIPSQTAGIFLILATDVHS